MYYIEVLSKKNNRMETNVTYLKKAIAEFMALPIYLCLILLNYG